MIEALLLAGVISGAVCVPSRNTRGRIARSATAVASFRRDNPCPASGLTRGACPGYVIDHVVPLKRCGIDHPSNMQWQTLQDAKIKDRWE